MKKTIFATMDEDRSDLFDYVELIYNSKHKHSSNDMLSPVRF
ncbi:IS3 family transposase [Aeromonas veronii]